MKIEIDIDDTKTKLRLQTTGKDYSSSSDVQTTVKARKRKLVIIQDAIQNRKTYTNVVKFMASPIFEESSRRYLDVNVFQVYYLQTKKMKTEFTETQVRYLQS